jgi:glycosyltransferase involved in cell wall biosynthesis
MERVLAQKANYFADVVGEDVIIITSSQHGRQSFYHISDKIRLIDLGINYDDIVELPLTKRIGSRIKAKKKHRELLNRILNEIKPDITISMFTHEMQFLPKIKDGSKKILEFHFSKQYRSLEAKAKKISPIIRIINAVLDRQNQAAIKKYDKFIVLTNRDAKCWGKHFRNLTVIPNPNSFVPQAVADNNSNRALAIGRLCPQKGFDILITIWSKLSSDIKQSWHLDIVGSGPDEGKLRDHINKLGLNDDISIIEPQKNIEDIYRSHSVFCLTSRYEGFVLVMSEAMSLGLSVIAFDCPCGPSDLINDGHNGYIVSPYDIETYVSKLNRLLSDINRRKTFGENASKTIRDNYTEKIIMNKWINLFNEIRN